MNALINTDDDPSEDVAEWTIRTLLRDRCSPELEELYVRLNKSLQECNSIAHLDELDELYNQVNSQAISPSEIVVSLDEMMRVASERALVRVSVELNDNVPLEMLCEAVDILLLFDPTDSPEILRDIMDAAEDADDAFCLLMEQLGTYQYDDWIPQILQIDDAFTEIVRKVCNDAVVDDAAGGQKTDSLLLKRLTRLVTVDTPTLGAELAGQGIGVGMSLESLYGLHVGRLMDLSPEAQVRELYSLAAISNESFESAQTAVGQCLDDLCYGTDSRRVAEQARIRQLNDWRPIFGEDDA